MVPKSFFFVMPAQAGIHALDSRLRGNDEREGGNAEGRAGMPAEREENDEGEGGDDDRRGGKCEEGVWE